MTLKQKLIDLRKQYASRGAGWDKQYSDAVMQTVLEHHGYNWRAVGQHRAFAAVAPFLFVEATP